MSKLAALGGTAVRSHPFQTWPIYDQREMNALYDVLQSGKWNRWVGERVRHFESAFATYLNVGFVLAVSSGTGALECALEGIELGPGDEVILPAYCFTAPANAVLRHGGIPVFVDVDPETLNIDPDAVRQAITDRTRAILPLHLFGRPADMDALGDIVRGLGIAIVEDAALAAGSRWRGQPVGTIGDVGIFSCQAEKNLNCGEGGIVVTSDERVWQRALSYSDYWKDQVLPQAGWDALVSGFRMTEFQGAVLLVQLERLDEQCDIRHANGSYLDTRLREIDGVSVMPNDPRVTRDSRSLYVFRYHAEAWGNVHRDVFIKALQAEGIPAGTGYSRPLHRNPLFQQPIRYLRRGYPLVSTFGRTLDYTSMAFPVAERACMHEAVWLRQQTLLCKRDDLDDIARGIVKIKENIPEFQRLARQS